MTSPKIELNNGLKIPQIGLGTWLIKDKEECIEAIKTALEAGYRHFDTAQIYRNEQYVGEALEASKIPRKDIFLTTKIDIRNFGKKLLPSFEESLSKLQTNYVDLLLLHYPVTLLRGSAWKKLEELNRQGKAKSIGVSNYAVRHLEELLRNCQIRPAINQVELHVYLQQPELLAFCKREGVAVQAYSPLAHGQKIDNPTLTDIGNKHGKTPAQIMLRWCIEAGTIPLPKSSHPGRIKENFDIFDFKLDEKDMAELKELDSNFRTCWNPTYTP